MEKQNKIIQFFDRSMAFSFYALIFFLPISIALVETFTVLALLSYLLKRGVVFVLEIKRIRSTRETFSFLKGVRLILHRYRILPEIKGESADQ